MGEVRMEREWGWEEGVGGGGAGKGWGNHREVARANPEWGTKPPGQKQNIRTAVCANTVWGISEHSGYLYGDHV